MTDMEMINEFLSKDNLGVTEQLLKDKAVELDQKLTKARQDFQKLTEQHNAKQAEVVAFSQQLEGVLQVILQAAKQAKAATAEVVSE